MNTYWFFPVVLIVVGIVAAANQVWGLAAVSLVVAVFGFWLLAKANRSEPMGR